MYEGRSRREIVAWITALVIAGGLVVLSTVYPVNSDLTTDVLPAANAVPPGAERAEEAASPAAKPADDAGQPAAEPTENAVARAAAEDAAQPATSTKQLGADPKFTSAADMPPQQQQFLSIVSDFAQKYETAPNDRTKSALRQQRALREQRARAICGIISDLTVTNWVGTVTTLPGTDQGRGALAISLDKRSTIRTWGRKYNMLIKPRTAAAIQLNPGQAVVFSGRFFRAKGDCITEHSSTLREAMTQPNWIVRFSAIEPAQNAAPPAAKPADDAAPTAAKPAEDAAPPAAKPMDDATLPGAKAAENVVAPGAEGAVSPAAKPAAGGAAQPAAKREDAAQPTAKPAENAVAPGAERAEQAAPPAAKPTDDAASAAAKPAENDVPPGAERAEQAASPAAKPANDAAPPAAKPAENTVAPGAERAEEAASPAAKPADDTALPAANAVPPGAERAEDAAQPAASMQQLGADPKFTSAADMPPQQQQFLSIISDFAQKYETAPNDRTKNALRQQRSLRQQRARAICGIISDLTVTNWVGTVTTLPGTDQGKGVLAVSLDKRSTIGTWGRKYNTLIKPRTAAAIQLSPGQAVVFSGRFFRAKGDCITEHSSTLREAMTQPNWIVRFSAIEPAQNAVPPVAKPAEDAAPPAAKPTDDAASPGAKAAENVVPPAAEEAASPAAKPADGAAQPAAKSEDAAQPTAKSAENAVPPGAERAEEATSPAAKPVDDAKLPATKLAENDVPLAAKPGVNAVPPGAERAEEATQPGQKPAEDAAQPAAKLAENAIAPGAERAEEAIPPGQKPAEDAAPPTAKPMNEAALRAAKPAEKAVPPAAEGTPDTRLPGATMQLGADLYEEDPKPSGKLYPGSVDWHAEQVEGGTGGPPDRVAQADIEIPELKLKVTLSIRQHRGAILTAGPRLEIHFTVPSDFAHRGINSVSGILMSGFVPIALSAVNVSGNSFEFDLGRLGLDRNLQLLKERTWFYVPLVYDDGGRALLSIEKDPRGERAFRDAHVISEER